MNVNNEKSKVLEKYDLKRNSFYLVIGRLIPDNNADIIVKSFLDTSSKKIVNCR